MPKKPKSDRAEHWHGQKWIRNERRVAIYLRDGLACGYCGATIEDGTRLTLDHLVPDAKGGGNQSSNLITACHKCNSSRGARSWKQFAGIVAEYLDHGISGEDIIKHINNARKRKVDVGNAKEIIARRGGFTAALQSLTVS